MTSAEDINNQAVSPVLTGIFRPPYSYDVFILYGKNYTGITGTLQSCYSPDFYKYRFFNISRGEIYPHMIVDILTQSFVTLVTDGF
jgi:hypothetical protein